MQEPLVGIYLRAEAVHVLGMALNALSISVPLSSYGSIANGSAIEEQKSKPT